MMGDMKKGIDIFEYDNYRTYLCDWMEFKRGKGLSARGFAKKAGFAAHDILLRVSSGQRNLSFRSIAKFGKALALTPREADYFENLVHYTQAQTPAERLTYYKRLIGHPARRKIVPLEQARLAFFEEWLAPVIFEMAQFPDFEPDPFWIAQQFTPPLSVMDVKKVMPILTALGLVREENGCWLVDTTALDTGDGIADPHVYSYHEHSLEKAADALALPMNERYYQVTTVAAPRRALADIERLAKQFENDVLELLEGHEDPKDEVYQLSFQAFPIVRRRKNTLTPRGRS